MVDSSNTAARSNNTIHDSQNLLDAETVEKRQFYYPHHRLRGVCEEVEIVLFKTKKTVLELLNSRSDAEPRGSLYDGVSTVRKGLTVFL